MFKGMPKIFWVGMGVLYSWVFGWMILEFTIPGLPLMKVLGVPACYLYNWLGALFGMNVLVSFLFFYFEEKREANLNK